MRRWTGMNEWYRSELLTSWFSWHRSLLTKSESCLFFFCFFLLEGSSKWAADSCSQIKSDLSTSLASLSYLSRCCQKHRSLDCVAGTGTSTYPAYHLLCEMLYLISSHLLWFFACFSFVFMFLDCPFGVLNLCLDWIVSTDCPNTFNCTWMSLSRVWSWQYATK